MVVEFGAECVGEAFGHGELVAEGRDAGGCGGVEHGEPVEQGGAVGAGGGAEGVEDGEEVAHLVEGEAERFHALDDGEAVEVGPGVEAEAAFATGGGHDQAGFLVVANGADAQPDPFGGLADLHEATGGRAGDVLLRTDVPAGGGHQWPTPS